MKIQKRKNSDLFVFHVIFAFFYCILFVTFMLSIVTDESIINLFLADWGRIMLASVLLLNALSQILDFSAEYTDREVKNDKH